MADAIAGIKKFKSRAFLAKTDISMAYRNLPLRPEDYHLVGFFGIICIILINVCLWAAQYLARFLKGLVLGCIGLVSIICLKD